MILDWPEMLSFGGLRLPFFTVALGTALITAAALGAWQARRAGISTNRWVDLCLGALIGGAVGARIVHVALHADYFADRLSEAARLDAGGLDPFGGLFGGLIGLGLAARLRGVPFGAALEALAFAPPLTMFGGFFGCVAAGCGYGIEVWTLADFPYGVAAEVRDIYGIPAPRLNTQLAAVLWSALVFALVGLCLWRGWLRGRRFGLALTLACAGMIVIGFIRADFAPRLLNVRADQILAGIGLALGAALIYRPPEWRERIISGR